MKWILVFLLMLPLLFAANESVDVNETAGLPQENITGAMEELGNTTQTFLGAGIMLFLIIGIPVLIAAAWIYTKKVKGAEDPGFWRTAAILLAMLGVLALIGAVLGAIIYLLTPALIDSLISP
jgi:hypothetical protein